MKSTIPTTTFEQQEEQCSFRIPPEIAKGPGLTQELPSSQFQCQEEESPLSLTVKINVDSNHVGEMEGT